MFEKGISVSSLPTELTKLRRMLLSMGAIVEQRVGQAIEALLRHDLSLAERVRAGDDEVDRLDLDVEKECVEILALHQPVAGDLRYVLAALRVNADLERIADLARSVAKRAIKLEHQRPVKRPRALVELSEAVRALVTDAVSALAKQDSELAMEVRRADKPVDEKYREVFAWAVEEVSQRGDDAKAIIDMLSIVRALERIADLATNIAEAVVFSVGGAIIRHTPVES